MPQATFNRIADAVFGEETFILRQDTLVKSGIHPLVRLTAYLRLLAYGTARLYPSDSLDENLEISETVAWDSLLKQFTKIIIKKFSAQNLNRCPTEEEINRTVQIMAEEERLARSLCFLGLQAF
jgi:hypothetical protein